MANRSVPDFQAEIWSLYSVAVCFTAIRFAARVRAVGLRGLKPDDFLSMMAMVSTIHPLHPNYPLQNTTGDLHLIRFKLTTSRRIKAN